MPMLIVRLVGAAGGLVVVGVVVVGFGGVGGGIER